MTGWLVALIGCDGSPRDPHPNPDADTDTDTDADSDTDSDADTDADVDTGTPPGRWGGDDALPSGFGLLGDAPFEGTGNALAVGDLDGDGASDLVVGAYTWDSASLFGAIYVVSGPLGSSGSLTDRPTLVGDVRVGEAGTAVRFVGDLDGDGTDDLAVGAPGNNPIYFGDDPGYVAIVHGPVTEDGGFLVRFVGEHDGDRAGGDLDAAGDLTGDGVPDVVVGAGDYLRTNPDPVSGAAYVVPGPASTSGLLRDAPIRLYGDAATKLGTAVAGLGDLTGDGVDDLGVGADGDLPGLRVYHGPLDGLYPGDAAADAVLLDTVAGGACRYPHGMAGKVDLDGDGTPDLAIGQPSASFGTGFSQAGQVAVVSGAGLAGSVDLADAAATVAGEQGSMLTGLAVSSADLDGDGFGDLMFGATLLDGTGAAFVVYGPVAGARSTADADARWTGTELAGMVGSDVVGGTDLTGDGLPDLVIGAQSATGDQAWAGAVYVVAGP